MPRKINLSDLVKRTETKPVQKEVVPVQVLPTKHLDNTHNINSQVVEAFNNLPWVQEAYAKRIQPDWWNENLSEEAKDAWKKANVNYQEVKKQSREKNVHALSDILTNEITRKINTDPVNAVFLQDFSTLLQKYHKDIYPRLRNSLSYNQRNNIIFTTVMNALWNKIATHNNADFDWLAALKLLKLCWFTNQGQYLKEIPHKESLPWYIQVDGGGVNGIKVENANTKKLDHSSWRAYKDSLAKLLNEITLILDHHKTTIVNGKVSHGVASSTYIVFKILQKMGKIPADKYDQIVRFVKFVDIVDSAAIEVIWNDIDNAHRTLIGLQRLILEDYRNIDFIYNQFSEKKDKKGNIVEKSKTWLEIMSDEYLENTQVFIQNRKQPLKILSNSKKNANARSIERIDELLNDWMMITSPLNWESFVVDLYGKLVNGAEVANSMWVWLVKFLKDWKLFIYSPKVMQYDDKTWSTFGDYTRWHLLFIDPSNISDWSRFEKVLFNDSANKEVLEAIRKRIAEVKEEKKAVVGKAKVASIVDWALTKFANSKDAMRYSDIQIWKEYDVVVNKIIDKFWVFVTFGKNADKENEVWLASYVNWLMHVSTLSSKQMLYFKSLIEGNDIVRVRVLDVIPNTNGEYKVQVWPIVSTQSNDRQNDVTQTA